MVSNPGTIKPSNGLLNKKNLIRSILVISCVLVVSACGKIPGLDKIIGDYKPKTSQSTENKSNSDMDTQNMPTSSVSPISISPMNMPDEISATPPPDQTEGLKSIQNLQPAKGIQLEQMFSQRIKDTDARIKRVENAVIDIRKDMDIFMPAIIRLVAIEKDIKELVKQLDSLVAQDSPQETSQQDIKQASSDPQKITKKEERKKTTQKTTTKPKINTKEPSVISLRIGHHKDKTRIVLDANHNLNYQADIDNGENLLTIELKNTDWLAKTDLTYGKDPLIESYSLSDIDGKKNKLLIIQLKHNARIINKSTIKPNKNSPYYRILLDLKSPDIHK